MPPQINRSWCVALLAGGESEEAAISRRSGAAIHAALASRGHTVIPLDPAVVDLHGVDWQQFDVAMIALHGRFGEDGQVQSLLESVGIPYTGSDAATSRLAFNKAAAKERLIQFGVPTPDFAVIHQADSLARLHQSANDMGYPLVIKPDTQGSSLGVTIVQGEHQLEEALRLCFQFDPFGLIEQFIDGTEWTVGLLDDLVMPPLCIETTRKFYDFQAKYNDETTRYRFDLDWTSSELEQIQDTAVSACRALGTRGLMRVDLRADANRRPYVLEVNSVPGMTDHSLVPKAAAQLGIDFAELCEFSIQASFKHRPARPHHLQKRSVRPAFVIEPNNCQDHV